MKILLGKPALYFAESNGAGATGAFTLIDTPREGTTTLNTTDGTPVAAKEEGGETVEHIDTADTYALEFEVFVKKGVALPFTDTDGVVPGEFAFKVMSAIDSNAPSFRIDRATVSASIQYAPNDSLRVKYTVTALKPTDGGRTVKYITGASMTSFSFKVDNTEKATQASTSAVNLTAGDVSLVITGENMTGATAVQVFVGNNVLNLTKDSATSTTATFSGETSDGYLKKIVMDGTILLELPTE